MTFIGGARRPFPASPTPRMRWAFSAQRGGMRVLTEEALHDRPIGGALRLLPPRQPGMRPQHSLEYSIFGREPACRSIGANGKTASLLFPDLFANRGRVRPFHKLLNQPLLFRGIVGKGLGSVDAQTLQTLGRG